MIIKELIQEYGGIYNGELSYRVFGIKHFTESKIGYISLNYYSQVSNLNL